MKKDEHYNKLLSSLDATKARFARTIIKKSVKAGLKLNNPIHRAAIRSIANIDYWLVMGMLQEVSNDRRGVEATNKTSRRKRSRN
jgi:hypothetical protein